MADPRNLTQRITDARHRLDLDVDGWLATADDERPWLVPLSFLWWDGRIMIATMTKSSTVRNVATRPVVRFAIGELRDVVLIDGEARVEPIDKLTDEMAAAYVAKGSSDPRAWAEAAVWITPTTIQSWREENELRGRFLMREGRWLG